MGDELTLEDALIVLRRRALFFLIPAVAVAALGIIVVMLLPAKYTAQGTILVESAQIPSELVRSTVSTYAQERIQVIKQLVMTRERLLAVADKYDIFPKDRRLTPSERVAAMRKRLTVSLITADGARLSGQRDGTIAFTVAYADGAPEKAHQVASEFISLFASENVSARTAGASNTSEFFRQETARLAKSVNEIEKRIADFKAENAQALPEYLQMHMSMLERESRELSAAQSAVVSLDEEMRFIETQLATVYSGAAGEGGPSQEIAKLKSELAQLRSVYRDAHPSVQGVRAQIAALEAQLAPSREIKELQGALKTAELELKTARETGAEDDPGVAAMKAALADAQEKLSTAVAREAASGRGDLLSSQLQGRLSVAQSRRDNLETQIEASRRKIEDLQARIDKTPEVERGLQTLTRDYDNIFKEYQEILAKQQEAELALNLEKGQKAERFTLLEPPQLPDEPSSPARIKLSVLALFIGLAAGGAAALGAEMVAGAVRGRAHLTRLAGVEPIAVIPHFRRETARGFALPGRRAASAAAAASLAAAMATGALAPDAEPPVNPSES
jgi:uncharacterized protein involved in exopolysaccharide biosynthesis